MRPKLLVVEDDPGMCGVWEILFARRGWEVRTVTSVDDAMEALDPAPDCLILDLRLPDGGGEEVLRRVREAGLPTRVIITTGSEEAEQLGLVRDLRPEALLRKPVDIAEVWREGLLATSAVAV